MLWSSFRGAGHLVEHEFFAADDLDDALFAIRDDLDSTSEHMLRVIAVVTELKAAAE